MKGFRTVAFNLLMAVVTITGATLSPELVEQFVEAIVGVWAAGNVLLRAVTNSPMFKKGG